MKNLTDDTVTITTHVNAPIDRVWNAWTEPRLILQWFGSDPQGKGLKAVLDVRPGGSYAITFQDSDQSEHTCFGEYTRVEPRHTLEFTWAWKSEPGVESLVTLHLSSEGDHTQMQFQHARVGEASRHNYVLGWKGAFSKLKQLLLHV